MIVPIALGLLGALVGSFLNVVVYRVPAGRSVVTPASACGACGHAIRWYDNIPVISWLVLRGRCRDCRAQISVRYPLVELAGAAAFVIVSLAFAPAIGAAAAVRDVGGIVASTAALIAFLYLAAISIALTLIDIDVKRLPNAIVLPAYPVLAAFLVIAAFAGGEWAALGGAGIGLALMGGLYFAIAFAVPGAMGFGDVKLAGVLGMALGWLGMAQLAVGVIGGFIAGGVFGLVLFATRRAGRKTAVPYGPWLIAGAWLGILAGAPIAHGYLSIFGLA